MVARSTSPPRRRRFLLLCIAVVALLLPMGIALGSADGFSPGTPGYAPANAEPTPFVPPGSNPAWIVAGPDFAGRTLHWVTEGYQTMPHLAAGAQQQFVRAEFWIEFAVDGTVHRARELFTEEDGSVLQASVYEGGGLTTVWGAGTQPGVTSICTQSGGARDPGMSHPVYLADAGDLSEQGFIFLGNRAVDTPQVTGIDGVTPLVIYPTSTTAPTWQSVDHRTPGLVIYRTLSADPTSRIVMGEGRAIREDGTVDSANASSTSDLYVYDPADVPLSVYDAPHSDAAPCFP